MQIALALSGGAAYGAAHIGVLQALEEEGCEIAGLSGTSAGSLVGTLYALGVGTDELEELARQISWTDLVRLAPPGLGLLAIDRLRTWMKDRIGPVDLSEAPIPLRIVATDLAAGEAVVFASGPADLAVAASCAIPGLFRPVEHEGRVLVDGGIVNNLPVSLARELGVGPVVASDLLTPGPHPDPDHIFDVMIRSMTLMLSAPSGERRAADLLITPHTHTYNSADLRHSDELIAEGYRAARKALQESGFTAERAGSDRS